ncbi:MAG: hypothetical protein RL748_1145 [Pseudomonadota bacterium]|jgi:peptidyl-tRNA hydrolase
MNQSTRSTLFGLCLLLTGPLAVSADPATGYGLGNATLASQIDTNLMAQTLAEKVGKGTQKSFMGRAYLPLQALDAAVTSFELQDSSKAAASLNRRLQNQLRINIANYHACPTGSERDGGKRQKDEKPEFQASIEPLFWNANWLSVVERSAGDCGGAHPFSGFTYSTWNLNTGEALNPWQWIKNGRKAATSAADPNHYFSYAAPAALNKIIIKQAIKQRLTAFPHEASEANACVDVIKENRQYQISLGKTGLIFTPNFAHVVQACTEDAEISYAEMMPFLNPAGRAALQALRQN